MTLTLLMLSTVAFAEPKFQVLMHDRAVAGQPIELAIRITNPDTETAVIPDLSNRPWLIQFQTVDPLGTKRTLHSTPPTEDPGTMLKIEPGEIRQTRFEVPTSASWHTGTAQISVFFHEESIGSHSVALVSLPPKVEADTATPVDQTKGVASTLWGVHRGDGTDLYLGDGPTTQYLSSVPGHVRPQLSVSRIEQHIGRWITWTDEAHTVVWAAQQDAHGLQGPPIRLSLPWPGATQCGRAATDQSGRLVFPACVPSPNGKTNQLLAAVYTKNAPIQFRKVATFKPTLILTNVDSSGSVEFVLVRENAIDWAPLGADTAPANRPVPIERIWRAQGQEKVVSASLRMGTGAPPGPEVQFSFGDESPPLTRPFPRRK
ncbi:MAG: hypothetical protein H8D71_01815 [Deltaproteobacteria bacterium]|nr:hypothetical protein [Deltaproteobacteria bacterium]